VGWVHLINTTQMPFAGIFVVGTAVNTTAVCAALKTHQGPDA